MPHGAMRGGQGRVQAERAWQDLGHMSLLGSTGGIRWCSLAKSRLVNSNQKEWDFGELCGASYLRGAQGEGLGRQGRVIIQRWLG